jgi:hypothetical protein
VPTLSVVDDNGSRHSALDDRLVFVSRMPFRLGCAAAEPTVNRPGSG